MERGGGSRHSVSKRGVQNGILTGKTNTHDKIHDRTVSFDDAPLIQAVLLFKHFFVRTLLSVMIMVSTPNMLILVWFTLAHCEGSISKMADFFKDKTVLEGLQLVWSYMNTPSAPVVWTLGAYVVFQLTIMRLLPGKLVNGPTTPRGNVPQYKDNGFACFLTTITAFWLLTFILKTYYFVSPTIIYDRFDEMLISLIIFGIIFCAFLYIKGLVAPSSSDCGSSGNIIFDYYWGTELYPRVLGFDVKVFTNCRFGMTVWPLLVCVFALKSYELHGFVDSMFVSATLQLVYCVKFFWWESGYLRTIDIILDRAGFYICWGCLVWVPGFYTSTSMYLVSHPVRLGFMLSTLIFTLGLLSIYVNYDADCQKLEVRNTNGKALVWGRKPTIIHANYMLENGAKHKSILLASGWWGLARHFHYVPEILLAFFWSLPALLENIMPYAYIIYLIILLVHRSFRDDAKCEKKYGAKWSEYCRIVPYRIIPFLF